MKITGIAIAIAASVIGLCFLGYWVLIEKGMVDRLEKPNADPFSDNAQQKLIKEVLKPAQEIHHDLKYWRPYELHVKGTWGHKGGDFVTIEEDRKCSFKLDRFEYSGPVELEKEYGGYFTEFTHEGENYVFLIWADQDDQRSNVVSAFIARDIREFFDQNRDYERKLNRLAEQ